MNIVLKKILGLDVGTKRVGVAIAEVGGGAQSVRVLGTFARPQNQAQEKVLELIEEYGVERIVVGLPLGANGQRTDQCDDVERFAKRIEKRTEVPMIFMDEFLSSEQAKEQLGVKNPHSFERKKGDIDAVAASIILSEYIKVMKDY